MARIVTLSGGSPWGLAISGGKDFGSHVKVTKVTPGGKAMVGGVQLGYYILAVNGTELEGLTHHEVQSLIRTAGSTLTLKITNEQPKGGAAAPRSNSPTTQPATTDVGRPRPPPPPAPATSPTSTPSPRPLGSTQSPRPVASTQSPRSPSSAAAPRSHAPTATPTRPHPNPPASVPQKQTPTYYHEPARPEDSKIVPDSGLSTYVQSTQQSPAFKKIHPESPAAFSPNFQQQHHHDDVDSASHQMKNVVIEEGGVRKTSQRPGPPPATPATFTTTTMKVASNTGPKQPAIAKPAPPPSVQRPQPPPSSPRSGPPSGSTTPVSPSAKISSRQGVCEACHQPIRGPYASAMGKTWHTEHFICYRCNKQLNDTTFVFEDDKIYCDSCYESKVAQNCFQCRRPIVGPMINAANRYYHRQCFRCSRCATDLGQQEGFNQENNQLFCQDCFTNSFGATCFACRQKISANELWVEAMDQTWHPHCFVCDGCGRTLEGGRFLAKAGRPFCGHCC